MLHYWAFTPKVFRPVLHFSWLGKLWLLSCETTALTKGNFAATWQLNLHWFRTRLGFVKHLSALGLWPVRNCSGVHSTACSSPQAASANVCNQRGGAAVSQTRGQTCGAQVLSDQAHGKNSPFSFSDTYSHIKEHLAEWMSPVSNSRTVKSRSGLWIKLSIDFCHVKGIVASLKLNKWVTLAGGVEKHCRQCKGHRRGKVVRLCADICCLSGSKITPGCFKAAKAVIAPLQMEHTFLRWLCSLYPSYCTLVLAAEWCQSTQTGLLLDETKGGSLITG